MYHVEILEAQLSPEFDEWEVSIHTQITNAADHLVEEVAETYRMNITVVGAVDTDFFRSTVHVEDISSGNFIEKIIRSDAFYSGVVEFGWIDRPFGQASYPGRYPARLTLTMLPAQIPDAFEQQFGRR